MYTSSTLFLVAFTALVRVASATPPACLLAALGIQPNPADLTNICGSGSGALEGNITSKCTGSDESDAMSIYASSCSAAGLTISVSSTGSSSFTTTSSSATATSRSSDETSVTGSSSAIGTSATSTSESSGETSLITVAGPTVTSGASATPTSATNAESSASPTANPTSGTAIGSGGYSTGNSTAFSGVAQGSGPIATTANQPSQTSPISIAASKFSNFRFRLLAVLSIAVLHVNRPY